MGFNSADTTRYPVLYVLDANEAFPLAVGAYRYLSVVNAVRDLIIVGVGYPVDFYRETLVPRYVDYTPSSDAAADSVWAVRIAGALGVEESVPVQSGGAVSFLKTVREDVSPPVVSWTEATV
jgi:predicted alpha/beta superfamily hydrolase